jgi:hypothetical protein
METTLFEISESPAGFTKITPEKLFSAWKLYIRDDVPMPDKRIHIDTCHKHVDTAIANGYMLHFVYDLGIGQCSYRRT